MQLTLSTAITIGSVVLGAVGVAVAGYEKYSDMRGKIDLNTQYRMLQQYKLNEARSRQRQLTPREHLEFCINGKQLGIISRCPSPLELYRQNR